MKRKKMNESDLLLKTIIPGMKEMKGKDITILNLKNIETAVCKYFVICSGTSNTHVSSICDKIRKSVSVKIKEKPWSVEGKATCEWILLDYSDIIVHIFQEKIREFYRLEDLWGDAEIKSVN